MDASHKKILKAIVLELRHILEGQYIGSVWHAGDLEQRLNALGVWRDHNPLPADELAGISADDREARKVVDAYLKLRDEAGVERGDAVAEFVRETAYTWANRLLALRCMEARDLIDEVILQKEVYGGRALEHNRLALRYPELCAGEDDGLFVVLTSAFAKQAEHLPLLFDPKAPGVVLKPGVAALKRGIALLSGNEAVRGQDSATGDVFRAPDAFGWAYQYWNTEEKARVFEKVRTQKGAKIEGADIIPATQLYTEPYMVKFLVQNSLGAAWVSMHPETKLTIEWEYYIKGADRAEFEPKPVREITFLDPACGSGHFLLEAFDVFCDMYGEEGEITAPDLIYRSILEHNLYGIDIDERAIQISEAALWMRATEKLMQSTGSTRLGAVPANLVATNIRLPKGVNHLKTFLEKHPEDRDLSPALEVVFDGLENANEFGTLLQIEKPLESVLLDLQKQEQRRFVSAVQTHLYDPTPVQTPLPMGVESYVDWKRKTLSQLRLHLMEEGKAADLPQAFFIRTVARGLKFFDLVARRYDIVCANPPFMGSANMGLSLRTYCSTHFPAAKRDLYAVFIERCLELARDGGYVAMVGQHSWMFSRGFAEFRTAVLRHSAIEALAHLGEHGFEESSAAGAFVALFTLRVRQLPEDHKLTAFRLVSINDPSSKAKLLSNGAITGQGRYTMNQRDLLTISESPIVYWIGAQFIDLLKSDHRVSSVARVRQGVGCADTERYVRFHWEVRQLHSRWIPYVRGGGYQKWSDLLFTVVDWRNNGAALKQSNSIIPSEHLYLQPGLTFTDVARGSLSVRVMPEGQIFSDSGPGIFADADESKLLGILNSRVVTYLLRITCASPLHFRMGYVANLPIPRQMTSKLAALAKILVELKASLCAKRMCEFSFKEPSGDAISTLRRELEVLLAEAEVEALSFDAFGLSPVSIDEVLADTGVPAGYFPLLSGYDEIHGLKVESASRIQLTSTSLDQLRIRIQDLFEGNSTEDISDEIAEAELEDNSGPLTGAAIPAELTLERISRDVKINPLSVYLILEEGAKTFGWQSSQWLLQQLLDRCTYTMLRFLGYQWPSAPSQSEPGAHGVQGVFSISEGGDRLLLDKMYEHTSSFLQGNTSTSERGFAEIVGVSPSRWVEKDFFRHHIRQFKKRPVVWQIVSGRAMLKRSPAYSAFINCHVLTIDTPRAIQSQHVRPQRQRYETEMRGIESIPQGARSDRQQERLSELVDLINELRSFDEQVEGVSRSGFGPDSIRPRLRQYAVDDAMLHLKAEWLKKLSTVIETGPLSEWRCKATNTNLHTDLPLWIGDAMSTLRHHCSVVGPAAPKQELLQDDPSSGSIASLICEGHNEMVCAAVTLACNLWWKPLAEAVFAPLRSHIKEAKDELKELKEEDYSKAGDPFRRHKEIDTRTKALRDNVKCWDRDLKDKTDAAENLRKEILVWRCPEARIWENWLASQPMYDAISGLDGVRQSPSSVAEWVAQESAYAPDINDGVRVNIAPLQRAGLLASDVLAAKDLDKAIADRADWRADERRWCREGKLPQPGWWTMEKTNASAQN